MDISQIAVFVFGSSAIWLVGRKEKWRRWGFILGLCGQPFWIYTAIINHQWGILAMTSFYTYSWAMGIYNFWIKKEIETDTHQPMESRCCGRCDGVDDICVADMICDSHSVEGCETCFGKRFVDNEGPPMMGMCY